MLWQFADLDLSDNELASLKNFNLDLDDLLTQREIEALIERISNLLIEGKFPLPPTDWPAIPWPPY